VYQLSEKQVERYQDLRAFIEQIPQDASVSVIGRLAPHVSNRAKAYRYRHFKPSDYFLMDRRDLKGATRSSFSKRFDAGELVFVDKKGTFELYREVDKPNVAPARPEPDAEPRSE
jgi:hypothetical protein